MRNASDPSTDPILLFMKSASPSIERVIETLTSLQDWWRIPILITLSALYFWTTAIRAERKLYWLDEICTVQISNLANLPQIWTALTHGADFNPPLIYVLTGFSHHAFGNTSLAVRLPEIIAIWAFCLSLYCFTYRFAGATGALTAFCFPLITTAYWYSFEARPHALVLGFAGIAVVCWQRAQLGKQRGWWLAGLGVALGLVLLSHAFGLVVFFPIALAEVVDLAITRRVRPGAWIAMFFGGSAILITFVLLRALKAQQTALSRYPGIWIVLHSYLFILAPAAMALGLTVCAIFLPWQKLLPTHLAARRESPPDRAARNMTSAECALIAGFLLVPIISYIVAFAARAPLFTRYSMVAAFGFACVLGLAVARRPAVAILLPAVIAAQYIYDFGYFIHYQRTEEPVTSLQIDANLKQYSERYDWIRNAGRPDLPIVLIDDLDFSPTIYYAPPDLQKRMIFGWQGNSGVNAKGYSSLIRYTGAAGSVIPLDEVARTYPAFFLFATNRQSVVRLLQDNDILHTLLPSVQTVTMLQADRDMELLLVQNKRK